MNALSKWFCLMMSSVRAWWRAHGSTRRVWGKRSSIIGVVLLTVAWMASAGPEAPRGASAQGGMPQPLVKLTPSPVYGLIGAEVELSATMENGSTGLGYGPFIDLVFDSSGADDNDQQEKCDGLELVAGKTLLDGAPPTEVEVFGGGTQCYGQAQTYPHPFLPGQTVTVPQGHQFVSVRLPVGSYAKGAPGLAIDFLAQISNYADEEWPLRVYARAGFIHGASPTGTVPITSHDGDVLGDGWESTLVIPLVMLTDKNYLGPEDEAATGSSHKDDYPLRYEVSALIAPGQTIDDLVLIDNLPDNLVFDGFDAVSAGCTGTPPPTTPAVGAVVRLDCPSATGQVGMSFWFHADRLDAHGSPVVNLNTCLESQSVDDIRAEGTWLPLDVRDHPAKQVLVDMKPDDHKLSNKCLAVQKSVEVAVDHGAPGATPGDLLEYTIAFQVTDFTHFGDITIEDFLSDGQTFENVPPVLTVSDGTLASPLEIEWPLVQFLPDARPDRVCAAMYPNSSEPFSITGGSQVLFDVSGLLDQQSGTGSNTIESGIMTGAAMPGGQGAPAWGRIRYRVRIDQTFALPQPPMPGVPGNPDVDKHDPLCNQVDILAQRMSENEIPGTLTSTGVWASDDSRAVIQIVPGSLEKTVIGRNGDWDMLVTDQGSGLYSFSPGDTVTFEIVKQIPSGDAEDIVIEDWLPAPILDNAEFAGTSSPIPLCSGFTVGIPPAPSQAPTQGACWFTEPVQLTTSAPASLPQLTVGSGNSLRVDFGDLGGPGITERSLHLRLTATLTTDAYADGLHLTNIARECERNTLGKDYCEAYAAAFVAAAPKLGIRKGVIWTSKDDALMPPDYSKGFGPLKGPIVSCRTGPYGDPTGWPVSSTDLMGAPLAKVPDADVLSGLDAGDLVRFAIVVENLGHAEMGAFDIHVRDQLPPELVNPSLLCVVDGTGADYPTDNGDLFSTGTTLIDPPLPIKGWGGALDAHHPSSGRNLAIFVVQAEIADEVEAGCFENEAEIVGYAGTEQGEDHVAKGLAYNTRDFAFVCVGPRASKSLVSTSEEHSSDTEVGTETDPRPVAIGEIVRYQVAVEVPEGVVPNLVVEDLLPPDLVYLPGTVEVTTVDSGILGVIAQDPNKPTVMGGPFTCLQGAKPPSFHFGTVSKDGNSSNNAPAEFQFAFNVQVCNTKHNNHGELKSNHVKVIGGHALPYVSKEGVVVQIVEPLLSLTKRVQEFAPNPPATGSLIPYEILVRNDGPKDATAFEVELVDQLPAGLNPAGAATPFEIPAGCAAVQLGPGPSLKVATLPPGCAVGIRFDAELVDTDCDLLVNHAEVTWMSLPGGVGTAPSKSGQPTHNQTGAQPSGVHGSPSGARDGSGGPQGIPNDYAVEVDQRLCGRVCGVKCEDKNQNGICEAGEPLMDDWTIHAEQNGTQVASAQTAGKPTQNDHPPFGTYCLDILPGFVTIDESMSQAQMDDGWVQTGPPLPHAFDIGYGEEWDDINFANYKPVTCEGVIHGRKFHDANGDGFWSATSEKPLGSWTIRATPIGGGPPVQAITDNNGEYWLKLKGPGEYYVEEVVKPGFVQTYPKPPRKYKVTVSCDANGAVLPVQVEIEGAGVMVPVDEVDFGNRQLAGCPYDPFAMQGPALVAWGDHLNSQIGGIPSSSSPVVLQEMLVDVEQGVGHTVGLTAAGQVKAWGGPPLVPQSPGSAPFLSVSAGDNYSVALDADGAIHVWRDTSNAQTMSLVLPGCGTSTSASCVTTPGLPDTTFVEVSAGVEGVAAIDLAGDLHGWTGDNSAKQMPGTQAGASGEYVYPGDFVAVATEHDRTVAIDSNGDLYGWGDNYAKSLPGNCASTAASCVLAGDFQQVEVAVTHSLALDAQGRIWAWGDTAYLNLPGGTANTPYMGANNTGFKAIAGGGAYSLALRPNGTLEAWGGFLSGASITPPTGIFHAIAAGGIDLGYAAGLRCPWTPRPGGIFGRIFMPGGIKQAVPITPVFLPSKTPSPVPSTTPTPRPTWTPAPPPTASPTPEPPPTRTPVPTGAMTATPAPSATRTVPTPSLTAVIRTQRGCTEDPAEVLYGLGETVPIQLRVDGAAQATVRVMYQWPAGGQERQIDGGVVSGGTVYNVSPPLVIPVDAPLGGRRVSLQVEEAGGSYRELARCGFEVVSADPPTPTTSPPAACMPLSQLPGMVAWWSLDEQRGEAALDRIANPVLNHGLIYGQPVWGTGRVGAALRFDGQTNYIDVPDHPSLDFAASPRGDFTLDAWIKLPPNAQTNGVHVAMTKQASVGAPGYQLYLYNAEPGLQLADASGYSNFGSGAAIPKDDRWHLLAVSVDRDQAAGGRFYLDGQAIGQPFDPRVRSGSLENGALLRIGGLSFQSQNLYDGWMDEVEVIGSALSAQAVQRLYQAGAAGKCPPQAQPTVPPLGRRGADVEEADRKRISRSSVAGVDSTGPFSRSRARGVSTDQLPNPRHVMGLR